MGVVTDRDIYLLKVLAPGPATFARMLLALKKVYKIEMSEGALRQRIHSLAKGGFLKSRTYVFPDKKWRNGDAVLDRDADKSKNTVRPASRVNPGKEQKVQQILSRQALYALTEMSAPILLREGYKLERIRMNLPSKETAGHELLVTEAVRTLIRERNRGVLRDVKWMDEAYIREIHKRKAAYPDLMVSLLYSGDGQDHRANLALEVDNGSFRVNKIAQKTEKLVLCKDFNHPRVLILSNHHQRLIDIQTYLAKEYTIRNKTFFLDYVYLAVFEDFASNGFLGTKWFDIKRERVKVPF